MMRRTMLATLLSLSAYGAERDPYADGNGKDTPPVVKGLVASDAIPGVTIPPGTSLRLVADHEGEGITSPTALTIDESGAIFVTETHRFRFGVDDNRDRLYWLLDDMGSQTVEDRAAMYEKWREKAPLAAMTERSEVVRRLSDQGADGRYTKSEVFADGFNDQLDGTAAGVFAYEGTIFLANIPKIYALRDNDGDGKAEVRETLEEGFGVRVSFSGHDLNGFALGPDGRIYGTIGDRGFNVKTNEGKTYEYPDQGAIFRFEPDGTNFEVIHTGLRNPKEIAFDAWGNAITVDNNSDQGDQARIVHVVEGGDSGWRMEHQTIFSFAAQIGLSEPPPSPWMNERMWEPQNDDQPYWLLPPVANLTSGPSGLTYYPGTGFLESEVGRFLVCDYRGGAARSGIWSFKLEPEGAGMKLIDGRPFVWSIGVTDVEYSWDGRVLITDFVSGWISHEAGRVFELTAKKPYLQKEANETARLIAEGFDQRTAAELGSLLGHDDMRVRLRAQLALTRQVDGFAVLEKAAKDGEGFAQLHGIWGLGVIARRGSAALPKVNPDDFVDLPGTPLKQKAFLALLPLLENEDPEVRAQTIRVIGEAGISSNRVNYGRLMLDASPRVRMFAAISAGKNKAIASFSYVLKMLEENDDKDPYLRHAGVHALELMTQPMQLVPLKNHPSPAVRMAAAITLGRMGHERVGEFIIDEDPRISDEAIRLIHDRGIEEVRPLVAALAAQEGDRERSPMMWRRILHSAFRLGDLENLERVLDFALDSNKPIAARREALRLLSLWSEPPPVDQSLGRLAPLPPRDVTPIRELLVSKIEQLMTLDEELLEGGLKVIEAYPFDTSEIPEAKLRDLIMASKLPAGIRRTAFDLLLQKEDVEFDALLSTLLESQGDVLALDALSALVKGNSNQAAAALEKALESDQVALRQQAWNLAGKIEGSSLTELFVARLAQLAETEGEAADALELLEAAKMRQEPEVKKAMAEYELRLQASTDPLATWKPALFGGDAESGAKLFRSHPAAQCSRCHDAGHGQAGPVLDGVAGRGDRRFLLESLVAPAARVAAGYGMVAATLKDGSSVGGVLVEESPESIVLDLAGERKSIPRSEITEMSEAISSMPPMGALMTLAELRDLVAWLSKQSKS
ncbi:DUF7133 domain-containing protein [Haloferula sp.]|uniref:DUF7133 domain-containing protein n=1 Tax=Haloferula sp. TaxID=2497595 RepID=UPI003C7522BD